MRWLYFHPDNQIPNKYFSFVNGFWSSRRERPVIVCDVSTSRRHYRGTRRLLIRPTLPVFWLTAVFKFGTELDLSAKKLSLALLRLLLSLSRWCTELGPHVRIFLFFSGGLIGTASGISRLSSTVKKSTTRVNSRFSRGHVGVQNNTWWRHGGQVGVQNNRWFSRYVTATMLVDENKRFLISSFCSSTTNCTLQHCYLCPYRLVANHL